MVQHVLHQAREKEPNTHASGLKPTQAHRHGNSSKPDLHGEEVLEGTAWERVVIEAILAPVYLMVAVG